MKNNIKPVIKCVSVFFGALLTVSCVTETIDSPSSMRFSDASVVSVQNPNAAIKQGSSFAWLPEAIKYYGDKRLNAAPLKPIIEIEIMNHVKSKGMLLVESVNGASYAIAYTAALESALDDGAIIKRFGLLPGHSQVPKDDANIEKGSLIIYVFNTRTDEVIWRSAAQVSVKFDMSMDERKQRVSRVIAEMFQTLPVAKIK